MTEIIGLTYEEKKISQAAAKVSRRMETMSMLLRLPLRSCAFGRLSLQCACQQYEYGLGFPACSPGCLGHKKEGRHTIPITEDTPLVALVLGNGVQISLHTNGGESLASSSTLPSFQSFYLSLPSTKILINLGSHHFSKS